MCAGCPDFLMFGGSSVANEDPFLSFLHIWLCVFFTEYKSAYTTPKDTYILQSLTRICLGFFWDKGKTTAFYWQSIAKMVCCIYCISLEVDGLATINEKWVLYCNQSLPALFSYFVFFINVWCYIINNYVSFFANVFECRTNKFSLAVDLQISKFFSTIVFGLWQPELEGIKEFVLAPEEEDSRFISKLIKKQTNVGPF